MPHKPPINRRQLKKDGLLNEEEFFQEISYEAGFHDVESVKKMYLGMVRALNRRLLKNNVCRLPHLGDFALIMQKAKSSLVGDRRMVIPPKRVLKFYSQEKWTKDIANKLSHMNRQD